MTTIPEEGQERESEPLQKINQKYPQTKIREVAGLAGRDPDYPLVLLVRHREYTAVNPCRQFLFCCGLRLERGEVISSGEGIIRYFGMEAYNTVTDDDDEMDFILDAEKKAVLALKDYLREKSGGIGIKGKIYSAHRMGGGALLNLEYRLDTEEKPVEHYSLEKLRDLKIPFPSVGNIIFLLNSIRQEAEEEGNRLT